MEFYDVIRNRYSCRAYTSEPVDEAALGRILEAARLAPTAANRQPFRVLVIPTAPRREALARIYHRAWFRDAPLLICVTGASGEAWVRRDGRSYMDVDVAIVMDHIVLAAANEGLGTCWVANFDPAVVRELLALPAGEEPIIFTPLGNPADQASAKERKPLSELVRRLAG
jgi:nitroreductase